MHKSKHTYGRKSITPKTKKLHPSVDLTAMVNLSFLLMLFFMLQSFIKKPQAMDLDLPDKDICGGELPFCGGEIWRTITLILTKNNEVITYQGQINDSIETPKKFKVNSEKFKAFLKSKKDEISKRVIDPTREGLHINIIPSKNCIYSDLISSIEMVNNLKLDFIVNNNFNVPGEFELSSTYK